MIDDYDYWDMRRELPQPGQGAEVLIVVRENGVDTVAAVFHDAALSLESRTEVEPLDLWPGYLLNRYPSVSQLRITTEKGYEVRDFSVLRPKEIEGRSS